MQYVLSCIVQVCISRFIKKDLKSSVGSRIFVIIIKFELPNSFLKVLSVWCRKTSQNSKSK